MLQVHLQALIALEMELKETSRVLAEIEHLACVSLDGNALIPGSERNRLPGNDIRPADGHRTDFTQETTLLFTSRKPLRKYACLKITITPPLSTCSDIMCINHDRWVSSSVYTFLPYLVGYLAKMKGPSKVPRTPRLPRTFKGLNPAIRAAVTHPVPSPQPTSSRPSTQRMSL